MDRLAAHIAARDSDTADAAAHWHQAGKILSDAGMIFDAGVVALEIAEHDPENPAAAAGLRQAIDTFQQLNATPWLTRAHTAAARG